MVPFCDPGSQSTHSSMSPNSFSSPASDEVLASAENERNGVFANNDGSSPISRPFHNQISEKISNCGLSTSIAANINPKTDSVQSHLPCENERTCSYDSNEDIAQANRTTQKNGGTPENNSLILGSILEGFNQKNFENYPTLPFMQTSSSRTHSSLPILNSNGSNIDYSSVSDYASKSAIYGSFNDNSIYHPNAQPLGGLKNTVSYPVQNNMTSFYQSNHQHGYNPFASTASYNGQATCDYGNSVSALSHSANNLSASRSYGYVGSSDLWNGSNSTIGYDAPGVAAAAAAASGVAAAAAAAAAINYGANLNHHSSYMAGIASQYGKLLLNL